MAFHPLNPNDLFELKSVPKIFVNCSELDHSYQIYNKEEQGFINIIDVDVLEYEDTVFSINCEPYDNFFTQHMLVFDRPEDTP